MWVWTGAVSRKRSDLTQVSFIILISHETKSLRTAHASMRSNVKHDRRTKPFIKYSSSLYFDNLWICNYIFVKVSELWIISRVTQRVAVRGLKLSLLVDRLGCHYMNLLFGYSNTSFRSLVSKLNYLFDLLMLTKEKIKMTSRSVNVLVI